MGDGMPGCKDEHLGSNSRLSHPHVSKAGLAKGGGGATPASRVPGDVARAVPPGPWGRLGPASALWAMRGGAAMGLAVVGGQVSDSHEETLPLILVDSWGSGVRDGGAQRGGRQAACTAQGDWSCGQMNSGATQAAQMRQTAVYQTGRQHLPGCDWQGGMLG
ncbi:MAG: hypothetical protein FRX49_07683 [Trebouxia sp. A1-2]|nr:MAG: hypothetical protein FRX49_07683 [Trebouxia sp. A1-2]